MTHWFVAAVEGGMNIAEETPHCLRCGRELTPDICGEEFVETGICADCWVPEDEGRGGN